MAGFNNKQYIWCLKHLHIDSILNVLAAHATNNKEFEVGRNMIMSTPRPRMRLVLEWALWGGAIGIFSRSQTTIFYRAFIACSISTHKENRIWSH